MRQINGVRLSTQRPGQRFGFPIFGATSTLDQPLRPRVIGAGTPSPQRPRAVFSRAVVGNHRFTMNFAVEYFVAILNGYTISYLVFADLNNNGTGQVSLQGDETEGGFGFGMNVTFELGLQIESHPVAQAERNRTWNEIFNQSVRPNVDLIPIILSLPGVASVFPIPPAVLDVFRTSQGGRGTIYGLFDRRTNRHLPDGQIRLNPGFTATGNLGDLIPGFSKLLKVLKFTGTSLVMGPTFTIGFPITIRLVRLSTPNGSYDVGGTSDGFGNLPLTNGPVGSVPSSITDISTVHSSNVGASVRTGVVIYVAILKITVFSASRDFEIFPALPNVGIFRNFIGLNSSDTVAQAPEPAGLPEVVWG